MKSKLLFSFISLLVLSITSLPIAHTVYGQTADNTAIISTKGTVAESSNFHGAVLWTVINGNNGIMIIQSPVGRGLVHISISSSTNCASPTATCLMSTVTDAGQTDAFKVGDTARIAIETNSNQETVSMLSGTLAGFDVSVSLSKIWSKTVTPVTPVPPTTNPVNSTTTTPGNVSNTNSTSTTTSGRHLSINLSENMGVSAR